MDSFRDSDIEISQETELESFLEGTNEDFINLFQTFCEHYVPRNPILRERLIRCIQESSNTATSLKPVSWWAPQDLFPPLPEVWKMAVTESMRRHRQRITETPFTDIQEDSLQLLRPRQMINNEVVEAYLNLIRGEGGLVGSAHLIDDFRRGLPRAAMDEMISYETLCLSGQIFIPIYHDILEYWSFIRLIDLRANQCIAIELYDSVCSSWPMWLAEWCQAYFPGIIITQFTGDSPTQSPGTEDCALFMLMGIRLLSVGSMHLTQIEADNLFPEFPERVLAEILAGKLNPISADHRPFVIEERATLSDPTLPLLNIGRDWDSNRFNAWKPNENYAENYGGPVQINAGGLVEFPRDEWMEVSTELSLNSMEFSTANLLGPNMENNPFLRPADMSTDLGSPFAVSQTTSPTLLHLKAPPPNHNTLIRQSPRTNFPALNSPYSLAASFAEEESIMETLMAAVFVCRANSSFKSPVLSSAKSLHTLWDELDLPEDQQHIFASRYRRELFSRAFYLERVKDKSTTSIKKLLSCEKEPARWKSMRDVAYKSLIWTDIISLFNNHLDNPSVALCGSGLSSTHFKKMNKYNRSIFINCLEKRLGNPTDSLISNLRDATPLCKLVINHTLPRFTLAIEMSPDLKTIGFATAVSTKEKLCLSAR